MCRNSEPQFPIRLEDLLSDPLIQLVMKADNVEPAEIEALFQKQRHERSLNALNPDRIADAHLTVRSWENPDYRSGVGIMLLDSKNMAFVGQRIGCDEPAWQMPQGGIERGESPRMAALRELREEVGTDNVEVLAESKGWLRYEYPLTALQQMGTRGRQKGQQQKWFAMRFLGHSDDINVATEHPEFSSWRWVPAAHLAELIIPFKRQLYVNVLCEFDAFHREASAVSP